MLDRAKIIDDNFVAHVRSGQLPAARSYIDLSEIGMEREQFLDLFDSQIISRHLDLIARRLKEENLVHYTIGSSGHEGNAAIAEVFRHSDMSFLHYRSGAFMVQRYKKLSHLDPIHDIMLSLMASRNDPISAGRHKVFGSVDLYVPPQTSTIASHIPKAFGTALSITRAKELKIPAQLPNDSVVLCSFGDASINHAVAMSGINTTQWLAFQGYPMPLVFICEDNQRGISVPTPHHWIEDRMWNQPNLHYIAADGLHLGDVYRAAKEAEYVARTKKQPVFLHMRCVRLMGHAGSDIESQYLSMEEIEANEFQDPLLHSARIALENEFLSADEIIQRYEQWGAKIFERAQQLKSSPKLDSVEKIMASIVPANRKVEKYALPNEEQRQVCFSEDYKQLSKPRNLSDHIRFALTDLLLQYPHVMVFGEDVAQKGGVYRVTAGLYERFGVRRVFDTLLDETAILGTAIGLAHNGFIPIPEIQFLAYLHNAEDQLRGEAATLSFFSNAQFTNPMVIRVASFAYQKGFGGHFHNDNSIAVLRDIPGIIIAAPSNGPDAARMLRACVRLAHEQGRICVFLEPIALYKTKHLHTESDNAWLFEYPDVQEEIELGEVGMYGSGKDVLVITYGNGYYLSRQAKKILADTHNINIRIMDLRWLKPLPEKVILHEAKRAQRILIVDECRRTGSLSEELMTMLVEEVSPLPALKRITAEDSFIPLGDAWKHVLPSREKIVNTIIKMTKD